MAEVSEHEFRCPRCIAAYSYGDFFCGECGQELETPDSKSEDVIPTESLELLESQEVPSVLAQARNSSKGKNKKVLFLIGIASFATAYLISQASNSDTQNLNQTNEVEVTQSNSEQNQSSGQNTEPTVVPSPVKIDECAVKPNTFSTLKKVKSLISSIPQGVNDQYSSDKTISWAEAANVTSISLRNEVGQFKGVAASAASRVASDLIVISDLASAWANNDVDATTFPDEYVKARNKLIADFTIIYKSCSPRI